MLKYILLLLLSTTNLSIGLCQTYSQLYEQSMSKNGYNFIVQSESFLEEKGFCFLIKSNMYYNSFPSQFDTMSFIGSKLYFMKYNVIQLKDKNLSDLFENILLSQQQNDSIFQLVRNLFIINDISMYSVDTNELSLPFNVNEGYNGYVVFDLCEMGNKYRVDLENTELSKPNTVYFTKLINYLNELTSK